MIRTGVDFTRLMQAYLLARSLADDPQCGTNAHSRNAAATNQRESFQRKPAPSIIEITFGPFEGGRIALLAFGKPEGVSQLGYLRNAMPGVSLGVASFTMQNSSVSNCLMVVAGPPTVMRTNYPLHLTKREVQVLQLICDGLRFKEIAHSLGISPKTVEIHKAAIAKKSATNR